MSIFIALFRGINVGGRNRIKMADLRNILEKFECRNVKTYIASGNVVFQKDDIKPDQLTAKISMEIQESHGFYPDVIILTRDDFEMANKNNPFDTSKGKQLHFYFLSTLPEDPDLIKMNSLKTGKEEFKLTDRVFYLFAPDGIGRSKLASNIEKCLGVSATGRNWNTIRKINSMIRLITDK